MAVPKFNEFFPIYMKILSDGGVHSLSEIREACSKAFSLTDEDLSETLGNGNLKFNDRVGWARTFLKKAGLIVSPERGMFKLSEIGFAALKEGPENITLEYLDRFPSFREFISSSNSSEKKKSTNNETAAEATNTVSPQELMDKAFHQLNVSLADDLMTEIMKMNCYDFEKLVVKLLVKMGYGSADYRKNRATKKSGDEGIDGIVTADRFGFNVIYTQAKLYAPDSTIGRPEIQKFLGALAGQGASKGIFITTAKFSSEARNYVEKQ